MPRRPHRYYRSGHYHYITTSCYQRRALLGTLRRRDLFVKILEEVRARYGFTVVGYVVMPEHIHLLISEPDRGTPSTVTKATLRTASFGRMASSEKPEQSRLWQEAFEEGHIWQRRFYDFVVGSEVKKVQKLKYIHRNPVARGLVLEPGQWK